MDQLPRIALVGVGNMGEALLKGVLDRGLAAPDRIAGVERLEGRAREVADRYGIAVHPDPGPACAGAGLVVLAVKPQDADPAARAVGCAAPGALVVSVCAGIPLARLAKALPAGTPVVRVMPNTPALVGCGASVYCANEHVTGAHREQVEAVLGAVGEVHRVDDESLLDAVTGLSGSGPAYVFTFLEALADGGVLMGLPRPLARALAVQTVLGAATLARDAGEHTADLKDRVTSPAGTTIEGLRQLEARGLRSAVIEAVRAATRRSEELGA